jgi:DNA-binding GntR family transcriptional regulator
MSKSKVTKVLPEHIAQQLSHRVIHGDYPPGHRLIEADLSREFAVSHGPIRDALRILQASGLVTIQAYRGAHVTQLSVQEVRELYQVRAALVSIRARWIAEDPNHRQVLSEVKEPIYRLSNLASDAKNAEAFVAESFRINAALTESLPNRWLRTTLQGITLQTSRYSRLALIASLERRQESAHLWRLLYEAMLSGDGDLAEKVAGTLSLTARDAAVKYLQQYEPALHLAASSQPRISKRRSRAELLATEAE